MALLLAVPVFLYIVYPLGALLSDSVTLPVADFRADKMGWHPAHQPFAAGLRCAFVESKTRDAIWGTLKLSILSVLSAGAWGLGLALLWTRREFPGRKFFAALGYSPVLMPPIVGTLAFYALAGETGALFRALPFLREWLTPFLRVLIVHTYSFGCFTFAFVAAALETADSSREEAARSLGANRLRTFFAATWPVIRAPMLAAALLTFMSSAASFSAPYMLDNSSRYLTVEIYNENRDLAMQRSLSVLLAALSVSMLPIFLYVSKRSNAPAGAEWGVKGAARRGLPPARGTHARALQALSLIAAVPLLLPPLMVVGGMWTAPNPGEQTGVTAAFRNLTGEDWNSLARSLSYGAVTALICMSAAALIALALKRASVLAAFPVEFGVMLAMALPGSSIAIALLSAFNDTSALAFGAALGGTRAILILAYVVRTLPLAVRPARAAFDALGNDLDDAANNLGAKRARTFFSVTLPLIFPSLLAGGLLCFITAAGEFVASALLSSVFTQPVSVRMNELWRGGGSATYALALSLMALCGILTLASRAIVSPASRGAGVSPARSREAQL